jgi:hypothetical protein
MKKLKLSLGPAGWTWDDDVTEHLHDCEPLPHGDCTCGFSALLRRRFAKRRHGDDGAPPGE